MSEKKILARSKSYNEDKLSSSEEELDTKLKNPVDDTFMPMDASRRRRRGRKRRSRSRSRRSRSRRR